MKKLYRNQTKEIRIGDVVIGGNHPVAIQSMTNTRTEDVKGTVEQIHRLEKQDVRSSGVLFRQGRQRKR